MLLAPALGAPPRQIAERLADELSGRLGARVERVEVAGPGFLNVFLAQDWFVGALEALLAAGDAFGAGSPEQPEKVVLEFVSANPTGPLTAASGRHAAFGDALARILEQAGHAVSREYYFNDAGSQIDRLGESIRARARGEALPEDGYEGDYVVELARQIPGAADEDVRVLATKAVEAIMTGIRATLEAYRVHFDSWFLERSLHDGSPSAVRARDRAARGAGPHLSLRGRAVAAHDAVRRRQGPRADPLQRRDDLLRQRRRLPREQARARLRPHDQPARLRPPRLHRADEGVDGRARASTRTGSRSRSSSSCTSSRAPAAPRCPSAAATS